MKPNQSHGLDRTGTETYKRIILTSVSAMAAETATFPIDLTKTRLQLQSGSPRVGPTNAFGVAREIIVGKQGAIGLYQGLSPAILRHLFYTPIRIVGYENLRNFVGVNDGDGETSLSTKAILGGISGVIAQVVASPADLVKVRMQADGHMVNQGHQPRYSGPFNAFNKIVCTEGFGGLWKGVFPNIQRAFLVNMGELACYDHAKRFVIQNQIAGDNIYAHTLASITSGLSATALSCPADVVKTRMMNQAASQEGQVIYKSSYDCLVRTVKVEGIRALWKGFFPTWARLGPWQFVFWVSYEKLRQAAGISSF
ncbi:mitochondrial uncoupling protein 3 [Ricinus communis]|uniref:Mitochondrial uncoupling protein, putative n=1 Tax=Ricinus communis TaxID=3988 RepID=B9S901_RICCO|nr:mitochondrial uncoupling protein 3 [Ricinus communis]EEF39962.1 mitochondrial uncoupling protein, putative [Ricinus communis]|eukprot:XP_002522470.1 mitochondrial uncoupling protein 3 [Ricinus communis]